MRVVKYWVKLGYPNPISCMYDIFTYNWVIFRAHVGIYYTHGAYGNNKMVKIAKIILNIVQSISISGLWGLNIDPLPCS